MMTNQLTQAALGPKARIAGVLYLIIITGGIFAELFVRGSLIVSGDAAITAHNILAHELLYRSGFAAGIIILVCNIPLALIFYEMFNVVNRSVSLLVVFFILVGTSIESINLLNHYAPLVFLEGGRYLSAFNVEQLQALAYTSLRLQGTGYDISLAFFGFYCLSTGYLIFRSTFLPPILGVLLAIGGLCYLSNSFAGFLFPGFRAGLLPYILVPSGVAEITLGLWLIVMGINVPKWEQRARVVAGYRS